MRCINCQSLTNANHSDQRAYFFTDDGALAAQALQFSIGQAVLV
jgi:hypothetical protein